MAATSGEGLIVDLLKQHNKPFSLQNIVDFMATQGLKKAAVSRAVDAAADGGKIVQKASSAAAFSQYGPCARCALMIALIPFRGIGFALVA